MYSTLAIDRAIANLAARYDGLVPNELITSQGHCHEAINNRVAAGSLQHVRRGVRALAGVEVTTLRKALAAALVAPGSWVSHTSALAIHHATVKPISLLPEISHPKQLRLADVRLHRLSHPGNANIGSYFDIPVSRPWRAVVESAAVLEEDELAVAMDSLIQSKLTSLKRLQRAHDEAGWYRGRAAMSALLNDRLNGHGVVRSFLEQDLAKVLQRANIPAPVRNHTVVLPNGKKREIDAAWPHLRCGLEAHSWQYHSNHGDYGRTMIRDRGLTAAGWTILPVVVADTRDPTSLLADLRPLLISDPRPARPGVRSQTSSTRLG
jgi:hypothetical protein